jgi:hypothetical protein
MLARLIAALALAVAPSAMAQTPIRSEVPIRQSVLSNGALRYSVQIRVGSRDLEAVLDTGSGGLRILPGVLGPDDAQASAAPEVYGYASGSRYEGVVGKATLTLGALTGPAPIHLIRAIGCFAALPRCPASRVPLALYGIASDGLPKEGFRVILGTDLTLGQVGNPLAALGVRRWIVALPRPGETAPGRLILNPAQAEIDGFTIIPLSASYAQQRGGALHDAIPGCLTNEATRARACGAVLLDTGSPSLRVANARLPAWADGAPATLMLFGPAGAAAIRAGLLLGDAGHATRLAFREDPHTQGVAIYAGVAPYLAYEVLYDMRRQQIGLRPRPPSADGPRALDPAG